MRNPFFVNSVTPVLMVLALCSSGCIVLPIVSRRAMLEHIDAKTIQVTFYRSSWLAYGLSPETGIAFNYNMPRTYTFCVTDADSVPIANFDGKAYRLSHPPGSNEHPSVGYLAISKKEDYVYLAIYWYGILHWHGSLHEYEPDGFNGEFKVKKDIRW